MYNFKQSVAGIFAGCIFLICSYLICGCKNPTNTDPLIEPDIPTGSISGTAYYSNSDDSSSIIITLVKTDGVRAVKMNRVAGSVASVTVACSKDGSFYIDDVETGLYTVYAVSQNSSEKAVYTNVSVEEDITTELETLYLTATGSITGKITLNNSADSNSGFTVFVGGTSYLAKTGKDGSFKMADIPAGLNYEIFVEKGSFTYFWQIADVKALETTSIGEINFSSEDIKKGMFNYENKPADTTTTPDDVFNGSDSDLTPHNITFDANGGTMPLEYPSVHINGTNTVLPVPEKPGYTFAGWSLNNDLSGDKLENICRSLSQDLKLYAVWLLNITYTNAWNSTDFLNYLKRCPDKHLKITLGADNTNINELNSILKKMDAKLFTVDMSKTNYNSIEREQFRSMTNLEGIVFPENTASIGNYAFTGCSALTNVEIPSTLTVLDNYVFSGCSSLTDVTIPNSVKEIKSNAFSNCTSLEHITIPNSVTAIGSYVFMGCTKIDNVIIPENVTTMGKDMFSGCSSLKTVKIPENTKEIPENFFNGCTSLNEIYISAAINRIGDGAFKNCPNISKIEIDKNNYIYSSPQGSNVIILKNSKTLLFGCNSSVIPDGVETIESYAFSECSELTSINIPSSVKKINSCAFNKCTGLTEFTIPATVETVNSYIFDGCTSLKSLYIKGENTKLSEQFADRSNIEKIYAKYQCWEQLKEDFKKKIVELEIPASVFQSGYKVIGTSSFYGFESLEKVILPDCITKIEEQAFYNCVNLKEINFPSSLEKIEKTAFGNCKKLENIILPAKVTSIGEDCFKGCEGLKSISVAEENTEFDSRNNCNAIIETSSNTMILGCPASTFPATVTTIGKKAFNNSLKLTNITIPSTVTKIDDYAFYQCGNLKTITLSENLTEIGIKAFYECTELTHINLPSTLTTIGNYAFGYCYALTELTIPQGVTTIPENMCTYDRQLTKVVLPDGLTTIGDKAFYYCSALSEINIPSALQNVGKSAFNYTLVNMNYIPDSVTDLKEYFKENTGLKSIIIPERFTIIGDSAFYNCTNLESVTIPHTVTEIKNLSFYKCSNLKTLFIPKEVTKIGTSAFYYCSGLESIVVEEGNPVYDSRNNCNALIETATNKLILGCKNTVIPDEIETYGFYAFANVPITSIKFAPALTSIYDNAFRGTKITEVTIPEGITALNTSTFEDCTELKKIVFPSTLKAINSKCFSNCTSLQTLTIPESVTQIGEGAFANCTSLTSLILPAKVNLPSYGVFYGCSSLAEIKLPNRYDSYGITCGFNFFINCKSLKTIVFPEDWGYIDYECFETCENLQSITILGTETIINYAAFDKSTLKTVYYAGSKNNFNERLDTREENLPPNDYYLVYDEYYGDYMDCPYYNYSKNQLENGTIEIIYNYTGN